jgi:CRISPR-associated protein Csm2
MAYFDQSGTIRSELLDQEAKIMAESFVVLDERGKPKKPGKLSLTSAQLRRFFGEFRQLEKKIISTGFDKVKPLIKMTKAKVTYAANPINQKVPNTFKKFILQNVDQIESKEEFEAFMLHFEAVVGFFYGIKGVGN